MEEEKPDRERRKRRFFALSPNLTPPVSLRRSHYLKGTGYLFTVQTDEWQWVETGQRDRNPG